MAPANPPSLLPRPIETRPTAESKPIAPVTLPVIDARLVGQLANLVAEARAGNADFTNAERSGSTALAAGKSASEGSEPWIAAQIVRSALQVARQRSAAALADLDALAIAYGEQTSRDATIGGLAEIQSALKEAEAIVNRQTARLETLNR